MSSSDIQFEIINNNLDINEGSIMDNLFAIQLKCNGYKLYYYDKKQVGELGFIIEHDGKLVPIEIKSGKDYIKHAALNKSIQIQQKNIGKSIVFCIGIGKKQKVLYIFYCTW